MLRASRALVLPFIVALIAGVPGSAHVSAAESRAQPDPAAAGVPVTLHGRLYYTFDATAGAMHFHASASLNTAENVRRLRSGMKSFFRNDRDDGRLKVEGSILRSGRHHLADEDGTYDAVCEQSVRYPQLAPVPKGSIAIGYPHTVPFAPTFGSSVHIEVPIEGVAKTTTVRKGQTFVEDYALFYFGLPATCSNLDVPRLRIDFEPAPTAPQTPQDQAAYDAARDAIARLGKSLLLGGGIVFGATTEFTNDGHVIVRANGEQSVGGEGTINARVAFVTWTTARGADASVPLAPWLRELLSVLCPSEKARLDTLQARGARLTAYDRIGFDDPYYDGTRWTTRRFNAAGITVGSDIDLVHGASAADNAAIFVHEATHTTQPSTMPTREREFQAYVAEETFRIAHQMPPHDPSFRSPDNSGAAQIDEAAIRRFVERRYPGANTGPSANPQDRVVGHTKSGDTIVQRADGSTYTRAPQRGDSYPSNTTDHEPNSGEVVDFPMLRCS